MSGQHAAKHHKVCAAAECFGNITGAAAAAVADNAAAKAVRGISTFDYCGKLRIADTGFNTRCTD